MSERLEAWFGPEKIPMRQDRDIWWHELVDGQNETCEATPVSSEHPLFI